MQLQQPQLPVHLLLASSCSKRYCYDRSMIAALTSAAALGRPKPFCFLGQILAELRCVFLTTAALAVTSK